MTVGTAESARRLGVSVRRVQHLIQAGHLKAESVSGRYLVDEESLDLLAERRRPSHVRALSRRVAWGAAALADGAQALWLTGSERSRLRARLRDWDADPDTWTTRLRLREGSRARFRAGDHQVSALLDDVRVARSGVAARDLVTDAVGGRADVRVWVPSTAVRDEVARRYGLLSSDVGNVTLSVADVDGLVALGAGGDAYRLIVGADLLELADARSRHAGAAVVRATLAGTGSESS